MCSGDNNSDNLAKMDSNFPLCLKNNKKFAYSRHYIIRSGSKL